MMRPAASSLSFMTLEEIERDAIRQTLERTDGNIKKAARILNVHRPTLYRKLRKMRAPAGAQSPAEASPSSVADGEDE